MANDYGVYPQMLGEPVEWKTMDRTAPRWDAVSWSSTGEVSSVVDLGYGLSFAPPVKEQKHKCSWCNSISFDDARGNCCCCGAPRGDDKQELAHTGNRVLKLSLDGVGASGTVGVGWTNGYSEVINWRI